MIVIWFCGYPSCEEVIVMVFGLVPYPSLCTGDCYFDFEPCLLCRGGCVGERSCILVVCICQILSGGSLVWEVLCGHIVKILLCEGGD